MLYGLYLSAAGVIASEYRQDTIANNLANAETVGFKKDFAQFQQRPAESQSPSRPVDGYRNAMLDALGGGMFATPTATDLSAGDIENTDNPMDAAIVGSGYFTVANQGKTALTRDGQFVVNANGNLVLANNKASAVLDRSGAPIRVDRGQPVQITSDGTVVQNNVPGQRIGIVAVPPGTALRKTGGNLIDVADPATLAQVPAALQAGSIERSNVDPTTELTQLIEAQRELEANANMIKTQDQTLGELISQVGKVS